MSTTEELIEATVNQDGTATVIIEGKTHEFTAEDETAARAKTVELVSAHASKHGKSFSALMHDAQGSWPVKVHPDGTVEPDTETKPRSSAQPARRRAESPAAHAAPLIEAPIAPAAAEGSSPSTVAQKEPAHLADGTAQTLVTTSEASEATAHPAEPAAKTQQDNPFAQKNQLQSAPAKEAPATRQEARQSFLIQEQVEEPATQGWRGTLTRLGLRMAPSEDERAERNDAQAVSQHWPGPRTIAIVNGKGGAGKTPTTVLLSAIFARYGGAGVLAWDNNQTRGTLGWRTEQGPHEATLLELLPESEKLLGTGAQSADLAHFVHHQTRDRFDVLRSKPMALASAQRVDAEDVDAIHRVASKYYRLIFIDSGNDESDPMWQRMIDHTDQLVVATTTRDDHAEAGALLLEALAQQNDKAQTLARNAVAVVTQADSKATAADVKRVAEGYKTLAREVATIPFDPAIVDGILRYDALRSSTQRAWLAAGAAVARGL